MHLITWWLWVQSQCQEVKVICSNSAGKKKQVASQGQLD